MSNIPWKHIATIIVGFIVGYGLTMVAEGYDSVAFHFSWKALIYGLSISGAYTGGLVQNPPTKP